MILKLESKDGLWNPQQFKKISSMMEDSSCVVKILSDKSIALVVDNKDEAGIKTELEKFGFNVSYDEESVDSLLKGSDEEPSCEKYENMDLESSSSDTIQTDSNSEPKESLEDSPVESAQVQDNIQTENSAVQEETRKEQETTLEQPTKEGKVMDQNMEHLPMDDIGITESNENSKITTNINEVVISDQKVPDTLDENIVVNDSNPETTSEQDITIASSASESQTVVDTPSTTTSTDTVEPQQEKLAESVVSKPVDTMETVATTPVDTSVSSEENISPSTVSEAQTASAEPTESVQLSSNTQVVDNQTVDTPLVDESITLDSVEPSLTNEVEKESSDQVLDEPTSYKESLNTTPTDETSVIDPLNDTDSDSTLESNLVTELSNEETTEPVVDTSSPILETSQEPSSLVDDGAADVYEELVTPSISDETVNQPEDTTFKEEPSTFTGVGMNIEEEKLASKIVSFEDSYRKEYSSVSSMDPNSEMLSENVDIQTYAGNLSISIGTCVSITLDLKNQSEGMKTFSINGKEIYIEYSAKYCKVVCDGMQIRVPMSDTVLSQAC